ncbi:MAG: hypothetical protein ACOZB3_01720 [Calditrichota bacterium]
MKKVMFVLVSLLLVSSCWALESAASNAVGYVKTDIPTGFQEFGLPFIFWDVPTGNIPTFGTESRRPSSIVGAQTNPGLPTTADKIIRQDGGAFALRTTAGVWTGTLQTGTSEMEPGRAYWYQNKSGAARVLVLAGQVDTSAGADFPSLAAIPTVTMNPGFTPYSWRDSRQLALNLLGLRTAGFVGGLPTTSDKVIQQTGGQFAIMLATGSWPATNSLQFITPGKSYWIQNKHATAWNYTYTAPMANLRENPNPITPTIQKNVTPTEKSVGSTKGMSK